MNGQPFFCSFFYAMCHLPRLQRCEKTKENKNVWYGLYFKQAFTDRHNYSAVVGIVRVLRRGSSFSVRSFFGVHVQ